MSAEATARLALRRSMVANGEFPMDQRTLTDADLEALAEKVIAKFEKKFYMSIGQKFWGMAWITLVGIIIGLAGEKWLR